jgi:hypothetical protein
VLLQGRWHDASLRRIYETMLHDMQLEPTEQTPSHCLHDQQPLRRTPGASVTDVQLIADARHLGIPLLTAAFELLVAHLPPSLS